MHVADSHDLIRVHGARVNNVRDLSVEIPKRRLTVFTGVSGSGKVGDLDHRRFAAGGGGRGGRDGDDTTGHQPSI
ncbi:MAG: hypothetical protein E6G62_07445 [Actinobacteria bacterium]|nr:MAG: hypothetical protein E6G62_07445 [Actinomycetota bacterium]